MLWPSQWLFASALFRSPYSPCGSLKPLSLGCKHRSLNGKLDTGSACASGGKPASLWCDRWQRFQNDCLGCAQGTNWRTKSDTFCFWDSFLLASMLGWGKAGMGSYYVSLMLRDSLLKLTPGHALVVAISKGVLHT